MTGMWPDSMMGRRTDGLTRVTSPTKPSAAASGEGRAVRRRASLPQRPTAVAPATLMRETSCLLTLPTSTISTTSMVSASVTRRPFRNCGSTPTRPSHELISGPPPCTSTGRRPTQERRTRSRITDDCSSGDFIAAPPYFTTTVLPLNRWMNGSASESTSTRLSAGAVGWATDAGCAGATEEAHTRWWPRRPRPEARGVTRLGFGLGFGSAVVVGRRRRDEGWGLAQPKPPQIVKCPQILPPPRLATSNRNPGIRLGVGAFPLRLAGGGIGTVVWAHWEGWLGFVSWRALMILTRSGSAPALLHRRRLAGCGGSHQSVRASPALRRKEEVIQKQQEGVPFLWIKLLG
uniref:Uncharacterized protein n=1 Tax=Oryza glumipatula TaxID=40148 RepID=A0A0D9YVX8_9ORYZ